MQKKLEEAKVGAKNNISIGNFLENRFYVFSTIKIRYPHIRNKGSNLVKYEDNTLAANWQISLKSNFQMWTIYWQRLIRVKFLIFMRTALAVNWQTKTWVCCYLSWFYTSLVCVHGLFNYLFYFCERRRKNMVITHGWIKFDTVACCSKLINLFEEKKTLI